MDEVRTIGFDYPNRVFYKHLSFLPPLAVALLPEPPKVSREALSAHIHDFALDTAAFDM